MSDTKGILKLAYIKGQESEDITITGKLGNQTYYCLNVMFYKSHDMFSVKHSAFISVCHASDNTNNHYGLSNNQVTKVEAITKAIIDSGLTCCNMTDNNMNLILIELAKELNPNLTDFRVL